MLLTDAVQSSRFLTVRKMCIRDRVKIAYVDQNRAGIDPDKKLWEVVSRCV